MIFSTLRRHLLAYYQVECSQVFHPASTSCLRENLQLIKDLFCQSTKVYFVLFLLFRLFQGNFVLKPYLIELFRSSVFMTINGSGIMILMCLLRNLFGVLYKYNIAFIPTLFSCFISFPIESRSRQRILSTYMAANCVETISRVLVSRNILPFIPRVDVLLFMLASGKICSSLTSLSNVHGINASAFLFTTNPLQFSKMKFRSLYQLLSMLLADRLPKSSILRMALMLLCGCLWGTSIGFVYNAFIYTIKVISRKFNRSTVTAQSTNRTEPYNYDMPLFLGSYVGIFLLCKYILHASSLSRPLSYGISGFVAGSANSLCRFPSISTFLFIKELQGLCKSGMSAGYLPRIPYLNYFVYAISSAFQLHYSVLEPENVNPAYIRFINKFAGSLFKNVNRKLLLEHEHFN